MRRETPFVNEIVWDGWNLRHVARHGVAAAQVEQVLLGTPVFVGSYKDRLVAIGPDADERVLAIIIGPTPGVPTSFYVFSARPASRKERRYYVESRQEDQKA